MKRILLDLLCIAFFCRRFGDCANTNRTISFVYNTNVDLECSTSGNFYATTKDGVVTQIETSDKYKINGNVLTIQSLKKDQILSSYICNSTGDQTTFINQVQPYLYQIETRLVVEIEEYPGELVCHILVGNETGQNIRWSWFKAASPVSTDDSRISYNATSNNTVSALKLAKLQTSDSAIYTCTAANDYGSFSRSIELRVKSKLTPVWPFLGVLLEIFILFLLIYVFDESGQTAVTTTASDKEKMK